MAKHQRLCYIPNNRLAQDSTKKTDIQSVFQWSEASLQFWITSTVGLKNKNYVTHDEKNYLYIKKPAVEADTLYMQAAKWMYKNRLQMHEITAKTYNNNNDRLTAFDPGQPG